MVHTIDRSLAPEVIIIGAGIVGAATAYTLAMEGVRVLVLDAAFAGSGATGAAMGHVVVMDDSPAQLALTRWSRSLWAQLASMLPRDCEDEACGTLWIAASEDEMEAVRAKRELYEQVGVHAHVLDESGLSKAEPQLRRGLAGGLFVENDRVLYPPAAGRWLLKQATERGTTVRERCAVHAIGERRVAIRGSGSTLEEIAADVIVNAAGVDAPSLTPGLPIVPRKGHLVITDRYPGLCHSQLVELGYLKSAHTLGGESTAFNVQPRATGQLLIGSSRELVGRDPAVNPRVLAAMLQRATDLLPALAGCSAIRTWTGFRPATPDKLPLIGPWPATPGVWIAAGHEGLGITTALATAALVTDGILGRPSAIDAAPYDPARPIPVESIA